MFYYISFMFMSGMSLGLMIMAIVYVENLEKSIFFMIAAMILSFSALIMSKYQNKKIISKLYEESPIKERPDNCPRCKNPYLITGSMFYSCSRCGFSSIKGVRK